MAASAFTSAVVVGGALGGGALATAATDAPPTTTTTTPWAPVELPQPIALPSDLDTSEPAVALGRITIPAIGVDSPLSEGIRLPTLDRGPGHWPGSALPGEVGNVVIGGHRVSHHHDFRDLDRLVPGDEVSIANVEGVVFTYVVDSTEITGPFSTRLTYQTPLRTATLFACHPPGSVDQRIVVHLTQRE